MSERTRIIIVILMVIGYNYLDQRYFKAVKGITVVSVLISMLLAMITYSVLVIYFRRKHKD
jgi:hypothetical protein